MRSGAGGRVNVTRTTPPSGPATALSPCAPRASPCPRDDSTTAKNGKPSRIERRHGWGLIPPARASVGAEGAGIRTVSRGLSAHSPSRRVDLRSSMSLLRCKCENGGGVGGRATIPSGNSARPYPRRCSRCLGMAHPRGEAGVFFRGVSCSRSLSGARLV